MHSVCFIKRNAIIATSQSSSGVYCVDLIQTNKIILEVQRKFVIEVSMKELKRLELKMIKSQNNSFELEAFKVFK